MNIDQYEAGGHALYERLAVVVAETLHTALSQQPELRLQHIQRRAKAVPSLRRKLDRAGALQTDNIAAVAKDLAGCRLVFYTNSDVARFQSSPIITDHFIVDWSRTKIHHPHPEATGAAELFISNNYVVRLKDDRVEQGAYADLRDLWCEVQVQTTLNHAWAEMAHDTVYKRPVLEGFGQSLMHDIENRMKRIMRDYLLPAGYEFQKVVDDFERLSSGRRLFDEGALRQLGDCQDNNSRYELLRRFKEYVLPSYDDLEKVHGEVRAAVVSTVLRAYDTETRPIETPFGSLPGRNFEAVAGVAMEVLDYIRYFDVEAAFDAVASLFKAAPNDKARERLLKSAEALSEHQMEVWKEAGPLVQLRLVAHIEKMDQRALEALKPVVLKVLGEALKSEISGTSATYNAVTFHRGAAVPSDALEQVRRSAIDILKRLFQEADSDDSRLQVLQTLSRAMQPPLRGVNDTLAKLLLRDTADIVEFYIEIAPRLSYELLEHIEHVLLWQYRHKTKSGAKEEDRELTEFRRALSERIFRFRDLVNADRSFVTFKTLVGFESVFLPEWEADALDVEAREVYRNARITELVSEVTEIRADEWLATLSRCARADLKDGATFISLNRFLEELGKAKPAIVMSYLDRLDARLAEFLPAILGGLEVGAGREVLHRKLLGWIGEQRHLGQIVWYQRYAVEIDPRLLETALGAAIASSDGGAVLKIVATSVARHSDVSGGLLHRVLLPALSYLRDKGDTRWVNHVAIRATGSSVFRELESDQADFVLDALVARSAIDYREEEILAEIAKRYPTRVVDFFGHRLRAERAAREGHRYEAVPFEFHLLKPSLESVPEHAVAVSRAWFAEDREFFEYRGARLLFNVFPVFTPPYERALEGIRGNGTRVDLEFLVQVLANYNGQTFTHALMQSIIEALPADDALLRQVGMMLDSAGLLRGEFGLVEAYRRKREEMEPWLADSREKVQAFAQRHMHGLDLQIAAEQRRSEEALEFRKRSFPPADPQ
jgi:ppGpp synthetase/RelA/SpoT-type nucleotidyltranferase